MQGIVVLVGESGTGYCGTLAGKSATGHRGTGTGREVWYRASWYWQESLVQGIGVLVGKSGAGHGTGRKVWCRALLYW